MNETTGAGEAMSPAGVAGVGPRADRAKRRSFTAEFKRAIVAEYDSAPVGAKGAVLRRERLYDSHVQEWRAALSSGTLESSTGGRRGPRRGVSVRSPELVRIAELEKQVARLEAEGARKDADLASKEAALDVLGKGVAFLEALSSRNA